MAGNLSVEMKNWPETTTKLYTEFAVYKLASIEDRIEEASYRDRIHSL
jgi:hypothetical protein